MKKIPQVPAVDTIDRSLIPGILSDPQRMREINRFNNEYYHWEEVKYRVDDRELESTWALMKILRESNSRRMDLCGLNLSYSLISSFQESLHIIDRNSAGLIELENPGKKEVQRYVISSLMEEAIASSQIEGAATTRKEAKHMLRSQRKPRNTSERMILNNYLAMEYLKTTVNERMNIDLILNIHRTITNDTLYEGKEWEGRFREDNDTVVGDTQREDVVFHMPPTYDKIPKLMQELCDFINNDDGDFMHPIVKGIIIHYLIGYIHPFVNGNGRLARALFYWFVIKKGYWLMEYTSISRIIKRSQTKYGLAYQYSESDSYDLTYFIKFNLSCILKAVDDLRQYIERKTTEQRETMRLIESNPELNLSEMMILKDYTMSQDTFSIREISNRYSISYQTARNYINHLHGLGHIRIVSKESKTRIYTSNMVE